MSISQPILLSNLYSAPSRFIILHLIVYVIYYANTHLVCLGYHKKKNFLSLRTWLKRTCYLRWKPEPLPTANIRNNNQLMKISCNYSVASRSFFTVITLDGFTWHVNFVLLSNTDHEMTYLRDYTCFLRNFSQTLSCVLVTRTVVTSLRNHHTARVTFFCQFIAGAKSENINHWDLSPNRTKRTLISSSIARRISVYNVLCNKKVFNPLRFHFFFPFLTSLISGVH